jgi:fatty-acyl-CoA synthase
VTSDATVPAVDVQLTLGEVVAAAALADRGGIEFHLAEGRQRWSFPALHEAALGRVAQLRAAGIRPDDRLGLVGPNRPEWVAWAYGAWLAGVTLVPLQTPVRVRDRAAFAAQLAGLAHATGCQLVVAAPNLVPMCPPDIPSLAWDAPAPAGAPPELEPVDPGSLALVQASSGTTGTPKGIGLTHENLVARGRVQVAAEQDSAPRAQLLAWNPFFHMSGITALIHTAVEGSSYHALPAERFARDPGGWLRLVGEVGATVTGAPSTGWDAALRSIERHPEGVDLSSLDLALFAMEMVDPDVIDRLVEVGGRFGLRPGTIAVGYGLTEGGGGGSFSIPGMLRIDRIDLEEFTASGRAVPVPDDDSRPVKRVVCCGFPKDRAGVELRVGSPDAELPERHAGEILLRGPGVESVRMVAGAHDLLDGWLRTGDIGYRAEGELFLTGRSKELIIVKGRNYHPEDLEWAAGRVPAVASAQSVAFVVGDGVVDEVVVAVELDEPPDGIEDQVRSAITNAVGVVVHHVVVVPPGTIPKAANGKLQRLAARDAYTSGSLGS